MEPLEVFTYVTTVTLAVGGWLVGHLLSTRREILQKQREIRIHHLREAYMRLSRAADASDPTAHVAEIQTALNDIQLFGDPEQIALVGRFVSALASDHQAPADELLSELRNEIRAHLRLPPVQGPRWHLRVGKRKVVPSA